MSIGHLYDNAYIRRVSSSYTTSQIQRYLAKIGVHAALDTIQPDLDTLKLIMFHHTITFPFENTDLHYTEKHHMPVTPPEIFERLVNGRKGSYCFGQNGLLLGILRGLGYRVFMAPGRVLEKARHSSYPYEQEYTPLSHAILLVQPHPAPNDRVTYLVDVGFGGTGPLRPILLGDGSQNVPQKDGKHELSPGWVWGTYPPERHRLVPGAFLDSSLEISPGSGTPPPRDWHFQCSHSTDEFGAYVFKTLYTFTEKIEFKQWDIDAASLSTSRMPGAIFYSNVVCMTRFITELDPDQRKHLDEGVIEDLQWVGKWVLEAEKATKRVGSKVLEERTFVSERERLEVIRNVFGIELAAEDEQWIVSGGLAGLKPQV
ncbi:cysteine proteinase [Cristinia sonorae]|uniref:Cysteine proteinase n=1 Tax=Cristinia sonorae TaxID=1940300 RepID=A0A8K0XLY0_9AGAR|nr:cysteine proteinase [Cristinia sonorae]